MTKVRIALHGAGGRMGRAVLRAALKDKSCDVCAALVRSDSELAGEPLAKVFGRDAPDLEFSAALDPDAQPDVIVDFTGPRAFDDALAMARGRGLPLVSGTTGLSDDQRLAVADAARLIPMLWSANFSLGVALLRKLTAMAATVLPADFDAEIVETHHRFKQDAPSGTALALGRAIADARRVRLEDVAKYSRHGQVGLRKPGEIGFAAVRAADIVGEHTVLFAAPGERIELTHRAGSRAVFAHGAIRAAIWLARQRPGNYDLADVLG
jgi:4-hydroxy-tetrahydrodipicolinate reductase